MLERLVGEARALVAGLDVDDLSGAAARELVAGFAELERLAVSGKLLATGRLVASGVGPGDDSFRDVDDWLASLSGTTVGAARAATKASVRVLDQPVVHAAVRSGMLSGPQTELVTNATAADPDAAPSLVDLAQSAGVKGLRSECDRVIAAAASREQEYATAERVHGQRSLRHTTTADGSGMIVMTGPSDRTALVMAALEPFERSIFDTNRKAGNPDHPDAVAFDALAELAKTSAASTPDAKRGGRPLATLNLHVSQAAYERGYTVPGEVCEIEGAGPIPVSTAYRLGSDAIIKALVTNGTDVARVVTLGRSIPAALRTAVETRDRVCVIEGCEVDRHLEIDHNVPYAQGGATSLENLDRLCHHHHGVKTRRDLRRLGPPGRQRLVDSVEYETAFIRAA
ncbi:MAG: HNH endonuclease [Acidimicrobiia bacterium]|nr:HNH endonuclease [Acidimicrobiia bacterium]